MWFHFFILLLLHLPSSLLILILKRFFLVISCVWVGDGIAINNICDLRSGDMDWIESDAPAKPYSFLVRKMYHHNSNKHEKKDASVRYQNCLSSHSQSVGYFFKKKIGNTIRQFLDMTRGVTKEEVVVFNSNSSLEPLIPCLSLCVLCVINCLSFLNHVMYERTK